MNILVNCLIYGNRPYDILHQSLERAGLPFQVRFINIEGIANAQNEGLIDYDKFDAIAYLSNDILEPDGWLLRKWDALKTYPQAGIVASSVQGEQTTDNQLIISNWLLSKDVIDVVGNFNESMFPYGPIDLDYCQRAWVGGFKTYYVKGLFAEHIGSHATGNEYGWNKDELVAKYMKKHELDIIAYNNGSKSIKM